MKLKEWINKDTQNLSKIAANEIYYAGKHWKQFDFKKGLDALIKKDETGEWIYHAGRQWKQFDYKKGLEALKKFPEYYKQALKDWPKNIEGTRKEIENIEKSAEKFLTKKLKLKEWINEI
jgi:hypothetical protein